jgi:hypothetical protein
MTDEERTKAQRLARAIASDISLYNEQKIVKGIEQDNLFDVLKGELDEGRDLYRSRVSQEVFTGTNFFERAVVDIIVRGKAHVKSKIWWLLAPGCDAPAAYLEAWPRRGTSERKRSPPREFRPQPGDVASTRPWSRPSRALAALGSSRSCVRGGRWWRASPPKAEPG